MKENKKPFHLSVRKTKPEETSKYKENMRRLKELEEENSRLKLFLKYGEVSLVETTVQEYQAFSKIKLQKIVMEFRLLDAGRNERESILALIAYLDSVIEELENLITI